MKADKVAYSIAGGGMGGPGGGRDGGSSAITTWVQAHYTATTIGGTTGYDLRTPTSWSAEPAGGSPPWNLPL